MPVKHPASAFGGSSPSLPTHALVSRLVEIHVHGPVTVNCSFAGEMIMAELHAIQATLEVIVSNQEELDARVAALQAQADTLQQSVDGVQQAIDDLKNQAPETLDFSGLDQAMANLAGAAADLATSDTGAPGVDTPPEPGPA